jgi:hypothetical protein
MLEHLRLSRWLFRLSSGLGGLLLAGVLVAPYLDTGNSSSPEGWRRVVRLFARDAVLRRTSLAGAAGLFVTAHVFFRPAAPVPTQPPRPSDAAHP